MNLQALQQQHWQLTAAIVQLQAEGDIILNPLFWLDNIGNVALTRFTPQTLV
ncbi:MAG TPA: hypothetical protein V6D34_16595 [Candidatus Sericytochromatia bacterium]